MTEFLELEDLLVILDRADDNVVPLPRNRWYRDDMSGTYPVVMGDRGRLVVPAELRARFGLDAGTPLLMLETPQGIVLAVREQVKQLVRSQLAGASLVDELVSERRDAANAEDR